MGAEPKSDYWVLSCSIAVELTINDSKQVSLFLEHSDLKGLEEGKRFLSIKRRRRLARSCICSSQFIAKDWMLEDLSLRQISHLNPAE